MTQHQGVDYVSGPSLSALESAGKSFVCRYLSGGDVKDLTATERDALLAAGIAIVVVWETDGRTGPLAANGSGDAAAAVKQAQGLGIPKGTCIYFAVDFQPSAADIAGPIRTYFSGIADVCHGAGYRCGVYGGLATVNGVADLVDCCWQTYAWSGGQWSALAVLRQYQNGVTLAGANLDLDIAMADDYGQFSASGTRGILGGRDKAAMFDTIFINTGSGAFLVDSDGSDFAFAGNSGVVTIAMSPADFNALVQHRQTLWPKLVAKGVAVGLSTVTINTGSGAFVVEADGSTTTVTGGDAQVSMAPGDFNAFVQHRETLWPSVLAGGPSAQPVGVPSHTHPISLTGAIGSN